MGDGIVVKVLVVIVIGLAVGVAIELALGHRQRSRRVVLDEPDLPPGVEFERDRPVGRRRSRRTGGLPASEMTVTFDDEGGFRILGPVRYDEGTSAAVDPEAPNRSDLGRVDPEPVDPEPVDPGPVDPHPFGPSPFGPSPFGPEPQASTTPGRDSSGTATDREDDGADGDAH